MEIFWRLVLAHFLADFTFQTNFIAAWKRKSVLGAVAHVLTFFLCGAALCGPCLGDSWVKAGAFALNGWAVLAALTVLHFAEDAWRVLSIQRLLSADSLLFFLWDQSLHLALIFVFAPVSAGGAAETWVLLGLLFVLVTHFTAIVVYFIEKDLFGRPAPSEQEKYCSMAERLVTALLLLLPGAWALSFLLVWGLRTLLRRRRREFDFSPVNTVAGNALALLFGFIGRMVYYS